MSGFVLGCGCFGAFLGGGGLGILNGHIHQVKKHQSLLFECEGNMVFFNFENHLLAFFNKKD